jgi:hypothetical protein
VKESAVPQFDLTTPALSGEKGPEGGMRLGELEDVLAAARVAGARDSTRLRLKVNREGRVQSVTVQVRPDDQEPSAPPPDPDEDRMPTAEQALNGIHRRRVVDSPQA